MAFSQQGQEKLTGLHSTIQCFVYFSEANQLFEVISFQLVHSRIGTLEFAALLSLYGHFEDCLHGGWMASKVIGPVKVIQKCSTCKM